MTVFSAIAALFLSLFSVSSTTGVIENDPRSREGRQIFDEQYQLMAPGAGHCPNG